MTNEITVQEPSEGSSQLHCELPLRVGEHVPHCTCDDGDIGVEFFEYELLLN